MSLSDPVADMFNRIRNAGQAGHDTVDVPFSGLKDEICRVLKREGFILDYAADGAGSRKMLHVHLKYDKPGSPERAHVIRGLERVSKSGCRCYATAAKMPRVRSGTGMAILTTSKGLMTDREARRQSVGGEVLGHIW
jgi:small subunit ribosomal protein S8